MASFLRPAVTGLALFALPLLGSAQPPAGAPAGAASRAPSNEDLRHVQTVARPRLSPDGNAVLVQLSDSTADGAKTHLWIVDLGSNAARQVTFSPESDKGGEHDGEWSGDGKAILFLARRGEEAQLFRLPMEGGEAVPYDLKVVPPVDDSAEESMGKPASSAAAAIDVSSYAVSPDGSTVAVVARDPKAPGEKQAADDKKDAVWVGHDSHAQRLYLLDPTTSQLTATGVPGDVARLTWSKQGDKVAAFVEGMNSASDLKPSNSAWVVSVVQPASPQHLDRLPPTVMTGAWSADGASLFFLAQSDEDTPPGYADLYRYTLATGTITALSHGFRGSLTGSDPVVAGDRLLAAVDLGTRVTVADFSRPGHPATRFETPVATQLATNDRATGWVWLGEGSTQTTRVYYCDHLGGPAKELALPSLIPPGFSGADSQLVTWTVDDLPMEGLLYLPREAIKGRVPLILVVHGGPTSGFHDGFSPFVQFLIAQGWAVFCPNPRGSTGYGAKFAAANKNNLGDGDYRDIMAGVDAVLAGYPIDPSKLGMFGYSYGGEMAAFIEGKTNRFRGIVSGAPVSDQFSEYGSEDDSSYDRWFFGRPWEHIAGAARQSPLAFMSNARTPFLLIQGEDDQTDPVGQSQELYRTLRQLGVAVDLVQYPREDHGPLAGNLFGSPSKEPWHGFDARKRIVAFFNAAFARHPKP